MPRFRDTFKTFTSLLEDVGYHMSGVTDPQLLRDIIYSVNPANKVQEVTATANGTIAAGMESVELNHATVIAAATIADSTNHPGLFIVKNTSASGTAAHTLTLTSGTFDGTNNVATLNAPGECLVVYFDSAGNGTIVENVGVVALS